MISEKSTEEQVKEMEKEVKATIAKLNKRPFDLRVFMWFMGGVLVSCSVGALYSIYFGLGVFGAFLMLTVAMSDT